MKIFTIGFRRKSAEVFFNRLSQAGVRRLIDVRLHNVSQLAGFTKRDDLRFFSKAVCNIEYLHLPDLAPTDEMPARYKKQKGDWDLYERQFLDLMSARKIEAALVRDTLHGGCLLCSEEKPEHCHRRLVAEYLQQRWGDVEIEHIL
jgi:uncharacterized protein (DUF488 family)